MTTRANRLPEPPPEAREPEPANAAEVAEALIEYGLQTHLGQALWRGFLLGAGHPKGDGGLTVKLALYTPKAESTRTEGPA